MAKKVKIKPVTKRRLMLARNTLTKEWWVKFKTPAYISVSRRLYSDDGQWYLARDVDPRNPNGISLYKSRR